MVYFFWFPSGGFDSNRQHYLRHALSRRHEQLHPQSNRQYVPHSADSHSRSLDRRRRSLPDFDLQPPTAGTRRQSLQHKNPGLWWHYPLQLHPCVGSPAGRPHTPVRWHPLWRPEHCWQFPFLGHGHRQHHTHASDSNQTARYHNHAAPLDFHLLTPSRARRHLLRPEPACHRWNSVVLLEYYFWGPPSGPGFVSGRFAPWNPRRQWCLHVRRSGDGQFSSPANRNSGPLPHNRRPTYDHDEFLAARRFRRHISTRCLLLAVRLPTNGSSSRARCLLDSPFLSPVTLSAPAPAPVSSLSPSRLPTARRPRHNPPRASLRLIATHHSQLHPARFPPPNSARGTPAP